MVGTGVSVGGIVFVGGITVKVGEGVLVAGAV